MSSQATLQPAARHTIVLRKWHLAVLAGVVLVVCAFIYSRWREEVPIAAVSPGYEDIESTVSTDGMVTPVKDYPARANFSGIVTRVFVKLGQDVRAGQPLLDMKDQYAQSRVDVAKANLDDARLAEHNVENNGSQEDMIEFAAERVRASNELQAAQAGFDTLTRLHQDGSASDAEVAAAKQRLDAANASMMALEKRTTQRYSSLDVSGWKDRVKADEASLTAERVSYGNAHITSPIDGTVYTLPTHQYDFVLGGADLLDVADLSKVHIRANFEEADIARIKVGQAADITWDGKPHEVWHGHIAEKPLAVSHQGDRSVGQCVVDIDSPRGDLPLDVDAAIIVAIEKHTHALTLPREAVHTEGAQHYVYRVQGGRLHRVPVTIGIANAMRIEITGGLSPSDVVALHALDDSKLKDKLDVTVSK